MKTGQTRRRFGFGRVARQGTRGLVVLGLFLTLFTLTAPVGAATAPSRASNRYLDPQGRFALVVAPGWTQARSSDAEAAWTTGNGAAVFDIYRRDIADGQSNVTFAFARRAAYQKNLTGYHELHQDFLTVAGQRAPTLDFTFQADNGDTVREVAVFVTQGTDGWILEYVVGPDDAARYVDAVDAMLKTFTI